MEIIDYKDLQLDNSVVALGKFQGLHKGHMLLINKILELAYEEELTSVLFTINMSEEVLHLPKERFLILEKLGIDVACECQFSKEFAQMDYEKFVKDILVKKLNVHYVVVGSDFKFGYKCRGDIDSLTELGLKYGFRVIAFDKLKISNEVVSSSLIRSLIRSGDIENANSYMGRKYSISGKVIQGKQLGRTIGFPTINMLVDSNKILPKNGVYETIVYVDKERYKGITNIGYNPTVNKDASIHIETHIIDFERDIYGEVVSLEFIRFLREEQKFNSLDELVNQVEKDKNMVIMHQ